MKSDIKDYLDIIYIIACFFILSPLLFTILVNTVYMIIGVHIQESVYFMLVDYITILFIFTGTLMLLYVFYKKSKKS